MTKKKRNHPDVEEILARPWCYYCERDFDDLKILINHQKAKHFKCERCGRRLNTAGGLSVHMSQVHKENLSAVDNALPNRAGLDIEIFGMEGIPEDIVQAHTQRVLQNFHQAEAERRQASGNQGPGGAGGQTKKPKFESPADLKKRLAEHKAAKLAAEANGGSSGSATPVGAGQAPAAPQSTPNPGQNGTASSTQYTTYQPQNPTGAPQQAYGAPTSQLPYNGPPQQQQYGQPQTQQPGYGSPPFNGQPSTLPYNPQQPFAQIPSPNHYQQPPQHQPSYPPPAHQQPPYSQPPQHAQYQQQAFQQHQPGFSPTAYQSQSPYPPQPYSPAQPFMQNGSSSFQGPAGGLSRQPGAGSPVSQFQQQNNYQPRNQSPALSSIPPRPASGNLPSAPGLPQRPAFQAPPVNAFQFQQMHQGQIPAGSNPSPAQQSHAQQNMQPISAGGISLSPVTPTIRVPGPNQESVNGQSIDDLISEAKEAESSKPTKAADRPDMPNAKPDGPKQLVPETQDSKAEKIEQKADGKKDKDKSKVTKLVYDDNEISPEEKMAKMARYAYIPDRNAIRV